MTRRTTKQQPVRKRIFLVEDHPAFRQGLTQILEEEPDLKVCGTAGTVAKAFPAILRLKPDLALVDITLPGKSGLELIKQIRKTDSRTKLLVLSMHDEALYADRVLRAGGDGYIMKQEDPEEIVNAIRDVLNGRVYVSEEVFSKAGKAKRGSDAKDPRRAFDGLGDLELEILALLGRGKSAAQIAKQLSLSQAQVGARCQKMRKSLHLKSDSALFRYAVCWVETGAT